MSATPPQATRAPHQPAGRLQGLDESAAREVIATAQALGIGQPDHAEARLRPALAAYPEHPEVLRLHASILGQRGNHEEAIQVMRHAVELRPLDALYHNTLGTLLGNSGDFDGAIDALKRACELDPQLATAWYNLGVMSIRCVRNDDAIHALERAVALDPDNMDARAQLADLLRVKGHAAASATAYREIIAKHPAAGMAWWGLADLRTHELGEPEIDRMRSILHATNIADGDRIAMGFALAHALDEAGRYAESLEALKRAHAIARLRQRWNAPAFSASIDAINAAFTPPPAGAPNHDFGAAAIFIVGMPRSGTTLVEQILASHSSVEGAGELPDLPMVLAEESRRRGMSFPSWVSAMQPAGWQQLGERYLERTAHWRRQRPRFTDKLPNNWMYIGAIRAMLPGAHVIVCRRDPLETCFSCYRQHLANNEYTRTPEDLGAFWGDFDRTASHFTAQGPAHVYQHEYEAMLANPEQGIRQLLDACGLSFEEGCLRFYESRREVRSPSATQVRQPLRTDTARTQSYGELLDPLRIALGLTPVEH